MINLKERSMLPFESDEISFSCSSVITVDLEELIEDSLNREPNSFAVREKTHLLLEEIDQVFADSQGGNVDNYGGKAGNINSYRNIREFIGLIPESLLEIIPTVLLEPDGSFALDWEHVDADTSFAVSFGSNDELFFAGLFSNGAKQRGVEIFNRFWFPEAISKNILRVIKGK